jgi:acetyl esterase/lipase
MHGRKEDVRIIDRFLGKMRAEGWAFIAIDYVGSPAGLLEVPTRNVRIALDWIRENAASYGINPDNMGLYSVSAGSHLTLTALNDSESPGNDWRFWLSECGPVDLPALADGESVLAGKVLSRFPNRYLRRHSPVLYIDRALPPTALVHGDADLMVALSQSERLAENLAVYGTDVTLKIIPGGDHGFFGNSQEEWMAMEDDFIPFMKRHFRP